MALPPFRSVPFRSLDHIAATRPGYSLKVLSIQSQNPSLTASARRAHSLDIGEGFTSVKSPSFVAFISEIQVRLSNVAMILASHWRLILTGYWCFVPGPCCTRLDGVSNHCSRYDKLSCNGGWAAETRLGYERRIVVTLIDLLVLPSLSRATSCKEKSGTPSPNILLHCTSSCNLYSTCACLEHISTLLLSMMNC